MSDILSIRLPAGEKKEWERAASSAQEGMAEFVRNAVRQRTKSTVASPWDKYIGSVDTPIDPPTNQNVRKAFARSRRKS